MARRTVLRYWGSHFKSLEHAERIASYFAAPRQAGWDCHLVTSRAPASAAWLAPLQRDGITIHHVERARGNFDTRCVVAARRLCRAIGADVMHCDNTHTSPLIGAALARVPVRIWTKHAMQPAFEQVRPPTWRERLAPAVRTSAAIATMILPISGAISEELAALGIPRSKLQVLPLPAAPVMAPVSSTGSARRRWALEPEHLVFGAVGRAIPVKAWDVLMEAFAATHQRFPQSRLLLVGSTDGHDERQFRARLDAIARRHGIGEAIVFTGHVTNVGEAFDAMDVFVLPSRAEGFSLALIEALAAGLPVVSTRVGIAPDIVTNGEQGLLVSRGDGDSLRGALMTLAADPALRARLAAAAPAAVRALPSHHEHSRLLLEIYESLFNRRERSTAS